MDELLIFKPIENDTFDIENRKIGTIGRLVYIQKFDLWTFQPIENFFYKPVHLAVILKQLNLLNGYENKKEEYVKRDR
jgi:hypothetical protein